MTISTAVNAVRMVTSRDASAVDRVLAGDPVAHCFVASRVQGGGLDPWRLGGELLGYFDDDRLESLLYAGANLVPVATTPAARGVGAENRAGSIPAHRGWLIFIILPKGDIWPEP